jgi:hypothetical protein
MKRKKKLKIWKKNKQKPSRVAKSRTKIWKRL